MPVSSNNLVTEEGLELGRYLFYDSILSLDYSMHCGSCHIQKYAFSDGGKKLSVGANGEFSDRNTPPLFNLAWYQSYFWDGRAASIEEQVFFPVRSHKELNLDWQTVERRIRKSEFYTKKFEKAFGKKKIDSVLIAKAIAQFERTLISSNSKFDKFIRGESGLTTLERKGYVLVNDRSMADCVNCHSTDVNLLGTNGGFANNGLDMARTFSDYEDWGLGKISKINSDIGKFKVPSIRNLGFTSPFMHDGRFETVDEVVEFYSDSVRNTLNLDYLMSHYSNGRRHLTAEEKKAVVAYLKTLNDTTFITNPKFSNPFGRK